MTNTEKFFEETFKDSIIETNTEKSIVGLGILCRMISDKQKNEGVAVTMMDKMLHFQPQNALTYLTRIKIKMVQYSVLYFYSELIGYINDNLFLQDLKNVPTEKIINFYYLGLTKHYDFRKFIKDKKEEQNLIIK